MAGFFAAAAKTPFSTLIIVSEMTGGYSLLLPSLWVCTLSFILSDEQSIYASQVESRSRSPAHRGAYVREVLAGARVREFLSSERTATLLHPGDPLDTVLDRLEVAPHAILPVVDAQSRLLGVVNLEEVHQAFIEPALKSLVCAQDLMRADVRPLTPDDTLDRALELFVENDLLVLPVVDDLKQRQILGTVHRHEISSAYLRRVQGPAPTEGSETP
jgi:CIC family chloride channel protein